MPSADSLTALKITMVGSGNVATHLSLAFEQAGHEVLTVYSSNQVHAALLASQLQNATATSTLDFTQFPVSQLYFLCVTDSALLTVYTQAKFPAGSVVVHTSGSLPLSILENKEGIRTGIFYPVQTFSKDQAVDLSITPIAIEAPDLEVAEILKSLAASVSQHVYPLSSPDRRSLHLAAVFACNFTNHLLGISREILEQKGLSPHLLHALVHTTFEKALNQNPFTVQTGPAVRGDANVMQQQVQQLEIQPVYQEIYELLSHSIQEKAFSNQEAKSPPDDYRKEG